MYEYMRYYYWREKEEDTDPITIINQFAKLGWRLFSINLAEPNNKYLGDYEIYFEREAVPPMPDAINK